MELYKFVCSQDDLEKCLNGELIGEKCQCYYRGYKDNEKYIVIIARLLFILIFEHVVSLLRWAIMKILPDIECKIAKINNYKEKIRLQKFYKIGAAKVDGEGEKTENSGLKES